MSFLDKKNSSWLLTDSFVLGRRVLMCGLKAFSSIFARMHAYFETGLPALHSTNGSKLKLALRSCFFETCVKLLFMTIFKFFPTPARAGAVSTKFNFGFYFFIYTIYIKPTIILLMKFTALVNTF